VRSCKAVSICFCEDAAKGEDGLKPKTRGFNPAKSFPGKSAWPGYAGRHPSLLERGKAGL
jgi:hypothetical protein